MAEHDVDDLVAAHHGRLFGLAYRMLGIVADAEDVVQEAFTRLAAAGDVDDPAAWLTTVVANLSIDQLRSARRQRETYVGAWLPEPLLTEDLDPADVVGATETLTLAFLVVLERLSPLERAVFLLHDVFGYPHDAIAAMLGRSHAAVRQVASRARRHVRADAPRYEVDADRRRAAAEAFVAAVAGGDIDALVDVLAPEVVLTSDGGGKASAARRPLQGPDRVARFLLGLASQAATGGWDLSFTEVNREPGLVVTRAGAVEAVFNLHVVDGRVAAIHAVRNPDKLARWRRPSRAGKPRGRAGVPLGREDAPGP